MSVLFSAPPRLSDLIAEILTSDDPGLRSMLEKTPDETGAEFFLRYDSIRVGYRGNRFVVQMVWKQRCVHEYGVDGLDIRREMVVLDGVSGRLPVHMNRQGDIDV